MKTNSAHLCVPKCWFLEIVMPVTRRVFSLLSPVIICTPIEPHYWYWHKTPFQCNQETNRNNSNEVNRYKHIYLRSTLDRSSRCVLNKGQGISPRGSFAIAIHIMSEPITCPLSSFESTSEDMPLWRRCESLRCSHLDHVLSDYECSHDEQAGYVHKGNRIFERFDRDEEKTNINIIHQKRSFIWKRKVSSLQLEPPGASVPQSCSMVLLQIICAG